MQAPFNQYSTYIKKLYNERVQKITVISDFTCPNRDGTKGTNGCSYCNNDTFSAPTKIKHMSIHDQIDHGIKTSKRRYKVSKFIVYFQAYSNTYAPLEVLKKQYQEALDHPQVCGLAIGTRPDCIDVEKLNYLEDLAKSFDITIEYGIESIFDNTLEQINRGHNFQCSLDAIKMTAEREIKICAHIILGFPWETKEQIIETAKTLAKLPIDFLKIHQLHIVKDTALEIEYNEGRMEVISMDKYIEMVSLFLEYLPPQMVIQRVFGESPEHLMVSSSWHINTAEFNKILTNYMLKHGKQQSLKYAQ